MSAEPAIQVTRTVSDADPRVWLILTGIVLVSALVAFGLARLARRLQLQVPTPVLVVACGSFLPVVLGTIGFTLFVVDQNFLDWLTTRPPRAYRNFALMFGAGWIAAALGMRKGRKTVVDVSTFE